MTVTTAQLSALRTLLDGGQKINLRTRRGLMRHGFAAPHEDDHRLTVLTSTGRTFIQHHVKVTGDGPEDLKAMFRFA